jgi:short-subunit dehydrogenase
LTAVLPRMVKRGHGRVAGISSIAARRGLGGYSCYSAIKAFVSSFLESIRVDLHGTGVTATCIEPGFVKTEINEHFVGITPMPFRMEAARAAEKVGRAILAGKRVLSFPWQLALGSGLLGVVPDAIYEPLGKRVLVTQTRLLAARAAGK